MRMTEYAMQDWGMRFETCKMIPRLWDMQIGYENLPYGYENQQMQGLIMLKWTLSHANTYRVYHANVWNF